MVDDELKIFGLEVGDAHVFHDTFITQFAEGGQCLIDDLKHIGKLHVVHVYQVYVIHMQTLHALVDTLLRPAGRVVPLVHAIFAVTAYLCRQIVTVAIDVGQGFSQDGLSLIVAVIGRHVDEIHTIIHGCIHSVQSSAFIDFMEYTAQRRCSKAQG